MRTTMQVQHAIETNRALLVYPQVTPLDIAISRTLLECLIMCVVIVFLLAMKWFLLGNADLNDPLGFLLNCAALAIMGFGVGLAVMSLGHFFPILTLLASYINRLLYFTSGIFFTLSAVPASYRGYVDWNPLLQAVEAARICYFSTLSAELLNPTLLAFAVPGLAALGIFAERATRGIAKKDASS
jgi:capsular polysaccharide transport system permease protein